MNILIETNTIESEKLEQLTRNLHLIILPSTLWAIHIDPNYKHIGFLHLDLSNLNEININKALIISQDPQSCKIKTGIFINNKRIDIPELQCEIASVTDISHVIYLLNELKLCNNSQETNTFPECGKYINFIDKGNQYCKKCVGGDVHELQIGEYYKPEITENIVSETDYSAIKDVEDKKNFICKFCNKNFTSKVQLKEHTRIHTGIRPYHCDICNKSNSHRSSHYKHMLTHSEIKPFLCNMCGKSFYNKYRMEDHLLTTHASEKRHECPVCFKKFATGSNLKIHHRTHTGDRPYVCNICGKTYTTSSNLSTHNKSAHSNKKPHACGVCDMSFVHPRLLRIHMRKHTGEKPFKCLICGKNFAKNIHLTVHMRMHTGEKPYVCTICGKSFTTTGNLGSHKRVHHKENVTE